MLGRNLCGREASIYEQTPDFFELREFRLVAVWNEINKITGVRTASGLVDQAQEVLRALNLHGQNNRA